MPGRLLHAHTVASSSVGTSGEVADLRNREEVAASAREAKAVCGASEAENQAYAAERRLLQLLAGAEDKRALSLQQSASKPSLERYGRGGYSAV